MPDTLKDAIYQTNAGDPHSENVSTCKLPTQNAVAIVMPSEAGRTSRTLKHSPGSHQENVGIDAQKDLD